MKILVCGGRDFNDYKAASEAFSELIQPHDAVCSGGQRGADKLAKRWCQQEGVAFFECEAQWYKFGKPAGYIRDAWMLKFFEPDLVIALPGGIGTANMVRQATSASVEVREF